MRILAKRLIVNTVGEIVDYELNKPFAYLHGIMGGYPPIENVLGGSDQVRLGASEKRAPLRRRSSPVNSVSSPSREFESPLVVPPVNDIEAFLAGLRFEKRNLLAELPSDLLEDTLN